MLLYIHIPFCDSKCHYCSFNSYTIHHNLKEEYMKALSQQLAFEMKRFAVSEVNKIDTIFIGGGTPSTVDAKLYKPIFQKISPYFIDDIEITVEANPNSATEEWLREMYRLGVNRLSLGVQSFNGDKLIFLGRNHTPEMAIDAIKNAEKVGFKKLSIDLIYNTVMDTPKLLLSDLSKAKSLPITHISTYSLTAEEGTPFENGESVRESIEATKDLIAILDSEYGQYEISNFGEPSRHNMGYWQGKDYIGIGSGAVGFQRDRRIYGNRDLKEYISNPIDVNIELLSKSDLQFERLFMGLRSTVGIERRDISNFTLLNSLISDGTIIEHQSRYYNQNYLLADEIAMRLQ